MKKRTANPTDQKCPACDGIGFPKVAQPVQPDRRIYPAPCKMCGGKGRIDEAAN
jgi:DnaJ-class molecular chaperone